MHKSTDSEIFWIDTAIGPLRIEASINGARRIDFAEGTKPADLSTEQSLAFAEAFTLAFEAYWRGETDTLDVPLDIEGTPFQQRVWARLKDIPRGKTRSYGEIAQQMGNPNASRAVAQACATNPVALAIPCHRVICHDGKLGGYRWGEKRKLSLLTKEHTQIYSCRHIN